MSCCHENTCTYADVLINCNVFWLFFLTHEKHIHRQLNVHNVHKTASVGTGAEQYVVSKHKIEKMHAAFRLIRNHYK